MFPQVKDLFRRVMLFLRRARCSHWMVGWRVVGVVDGFVGWLFWRYISSVRSPMSQRIYFITFCTWERLELSPPARKVVMQSCQFFDGKRYQIFAGAIMPDHVHLLIQPWVKEEGKFWTIGNILHSIKSYSAKQIPHVMPHIGKIWQDGRHERLISDRKHFQTTWEYIRQNPIKANIAKQPSTYPFFWQKSDYSGRHFH